MELFTVLKRACFFLCLFTLFATFPAPAFSSTPLKLTAEERAWVKNNPVVRLAPDPDFPPIEYIDSNGQYKGIAADFIALLEKKLPLKFEVVQLENWSQVVQGAKDRTIDMFGAAAPTPDRLQYMMFTRPFVEFPAVVLVRDSVTEFPKLKELSGKRVAVVKNYADHDYMKRVYPDIPLEVMPDISSGLRQVSFGKVDAMILNIASASYYITKDGISNLHVTEDTDFIFDLSFATRSDWPLLNSILSKGMAAITPQERKAILDNWISLGAESWTPSPVFIVNLIALVLLLSLLVILQWNRSLKGQVRQRTQDLQNELEERLIAQEEKDKLEKQINRSKKMEALGMLAGGVAHDLNNILSGVTGYAELMLMKLPEDSPFRKHAGAIHDSGRRASAVVADMLTISRDAASDRKVVKLNRLVREYLSSPEHAALVERYPEVEFQTNLCDELSNISASITHLKKTIMNLVMNAAEASEVGQVSLTTRNCYVSEPFGNVTTVDVGDYVLLQVADSGSGIAADDLEHIFEPFFTRKKMGRSGTGLGLTVVWNTVQDHHGFVDVEPLEQGSCFNVYLPVSTANLTEENVAAAIETLQGNGEHILVVDDEEQVRDLALQMLGVLRYQATCVSSGEEALEFLRKQNVDLLLLDMIMEPGINGGETYRQAAKLYPGIKAVICSGFSENIDVEQAQAAGAGPYLKKPYLLHELGQVIKAELGK